MNGYDELLSLESGIDLDEYVSDMFDNSNSKLSDFFRPLLALESFSCVGCIHLHGEFCSFFVDFVNSGVDFQEIPSTCQLSDFVFDGSTISFKNKRV